MQQVNSHPKAWVAPLRWLVVGLIGILVILWGIFTPEGLLGKADAIGYAVCHRIDLRSFHLGDRPLPLCARCSGMYLGALVGIVYQFMVGRRRVGFPNWQVAVILVFLVGAFAVDGGNSFLALLFQHGLLYNPSNVLRLFTGTGMGIVIATALVPAFNQTVWKDCQESAVIQSLRSFLVMVFLAIVVDGLVLLELPAILYILALLSAGSVVLILTMLYTMVFLMATHQENQYERTSQVSFALIVGFGIGFMQIGFLDFIRFLLTGTWEGFHFG